MRSARALVVSVCLRPPEPVLVGGDDARENQIFDQKSPISSAMRLNCYRRRVRTMTAATP
jgi:hypothetical protein